MINNQIVFNILKYAGIILLVLAFVLFGRFLDKALEHKQIDKEYLLKKKKVLIGFVASLFISVLFLVLSYYANPISYEYWLAANIDLPTFGRFILVILSVLVFVITFIVFLSLFVFYYFFESSYKNPKKVFFLMLLSIVLLIAGLSLLAGTSAKFLQYPLCNRIYIGSKGIYLVTTYTGYDWHSAPTEGFGVQIALYALCILSGACISLFVVSHRLKVEYGQGGLISNLFLIAFPSGIVGARLWYVIGNWERDGFCNDFGKIFRISDGGLAIMGGSLGIVVGIIYLLVIKYSLKKKPYTRMNYLHLLDLAVPSILIAQGIGRWGNFFNNEVHGELVLRETFNWLNNVVLNNMAFSSAHRVGNITYALEKLNSGQIYLPLFFIECLINIAGYFVIEYFFVGFGQKMASKVITSRKEAGKKINFLGSLLRLFTCEGCGLGYYLAWYGLTRAILEPLRDSDFNMGNDNNWSVYSAYYLIGIGLLIVIIFGVWQLLRDSGKLKIKIEGETNGN